MKERIQIVSDGTAMGTKVLDASGKDITSMLGVTRIDWSVPGAFSLPGSAEAILHCEGVKVQIQGEPERTFYAVSMADGEYVVKNGVAQLKGE